MADFAMSRWWRRATACEGKAHGLQELMAQVRQHRKELLIVCYGEGAVPVSANHADPDHSREEGYHHNRKEPGRQRSFPKGQLHLQDVFLRTIGNAGEATGAFG